MVILGVLLLVVAVVVLVDMGVASSGSTDLHLLGWHLGAAGPGRVLLLGAAIGAVLTLGAALVLSGQLRSRRKRRERDRTIKGTRAENKRLAAALEEQQAATAALPADDSSVPVKDEHRHRLRHDKGSAGSDQAVPTGSGSTSNASTSNVPAYPEDPRADGAEYVLGSRYPHETSVASTPPPPRERPAS